MKNPFKTKQNIIDRTVKFLHLRKEKNRDKYLKLSLKILILIAIFLAGYLVAKLQTLSA